MRPSIPPHCSILIRLSSTPNPGQPTNSPFQYHTRPPSLPYLPNSSTNLPTPLTAPHSVRAQTPKRNTPSTLSHPPKTSPSTQNLHPKNPTTNTHCSSNAPLPTPRNTRIPLFFPIVGAHPWYINLITKEVVSNPPTPKTTMNSGIW